MYLNNLGFIVKIVYRMVELFVEYSFFLKKKTDDLFKIWKLPTILQKARR